MLIKFQDYEFKDVYVNPNDVIAVQECDDRRNLSYIRTRDGGCFQVKGTPGQIVHELDKRKDGGR